MAKQVLKLVSPCAWCTAIVAASTLLVAVNPVNAQLGQRLLSRDDVGRMGLTRAWFAQVEIDRARNQVERAVLEGDTLVILTTSGVIQAIDANTGETHWTAPIGNANYPSLGPAVSDEHIALVNGSTLYVLDRRDGKPIKIRPVGGAPGASPALSKEYVFVPLVKGRIEGYPIDKEVLTPWYYQSFGRTMVPPLATAELVAWPTDRGYVYVAGSEDPGVRFRLETGSDFIAPPAYAKPNFYVANIAGEVFAMDESTGARRWKHATGYPITRAPAVIENRLFVTSEKPSLVALDAETGSELWEAYGVTKFAAASKHRVYGIDDLGALVVLDASSGAPLGRLMTDGVTGALVNDQTDRIYLISADGLVQCLHEIGVKEPMRHAQPDAPAEKPGQPGAYETDGAPGASQPAGRPNPAGQPPAEGEEDPFAAEDQPADAQPAEDATIEETDAPASAEGFGTDEENPFGFDE